MASAPPNQRAPGAPMPYVGSRISLISKSAIRYVGTLYTIDTKESTVALKDVKSYGTEGRQREGGPVEPSDRIYSYIVFRGPDILDLQFINTNSVPQSPPQPKPLAHSAPLVSQPMSSQPVPAHQLHHDPVQQQKPVAYQPPLQKEPLPPVKPEPSQTVPVTSVSPTVSPTVSPSVSSQVPVVSQPLNGPSNHHQQQQQQQPQPVSKPAQEQKRIPFRGPTLRAWGPPPSAPVREVEVRAPNGIPKASELNGVAQSNGNTIPAPNNIYSKPNEARGRDQGRPRGRGRGRSGAGGRQPGGWRRGPGIKIPEEDFDFESMHEKFDKASIAESFAQGNGGANGVANGDTKGFPQATLLYDKNKSFFDELIPEKEMRPERVNAAQRRATDMETFGETVSGFHRNQYRNGKGRRGRGRGRGRGGRNANGPRGGGRQESRQEAR